MGQPADGDIVVNVKMPDDYPAENLAGKEAVFDCKIKEIRVKKNAELNDEFAKNLGLESLNILRDQMRERIKGNIPQFVVKRLNVYY